MTNGNNDRLDRTERILERHAVRQEAFDQRQEAISQQQQISIRLIELLGQRVASNTKAIETLTSDIATTRRVSASQTLLTGGS